MTRPRSRSRAKRARHAAGRSTRRRGTRLLILAAGALLLSTVCVGIVLAAHAAQRRPLAWILGLAGLELAMHAIRLLRRGRRYLIGAAGERRVARRLRRLRRYGWVAVHDVDRGAGNIDHVLAGPGGIATIETKLTRAGRQEIAQARAHAAWAAARTGRPVVPILCLAARKTRPHLVAGVWVVGVRHLPRFVRQLRGPAADPRLLKTLAV